MLSYRMPLQQTLLTVTSREKELAGSILPTGSERVRIDSSDNFSGYAWGEKTGRISFNCGY
jgi:hypothetical protein